MPIHKKIRSLRTEKGLTIYAAAKGIGICFKTLKLLEAGIYRPRVSTLIKISHFYGIALFDLFEECQQ